jgi:hypothetical protein
VQVKAEQASRERVQQQLNFEQIALATKTDELASLVMTLEKERGKWDSLAALQQEALERAKAERDSAVLHSRSQQAQVTTSILCVPISTTSQTTVPITAALSRSLWHCVPSMVPHSETSAVDATAWSMLARAERRLTSAKGKAAIWRS